MSGILGAVDDSGTVYPLPLWAPGPGSVLGQPSSGRERTLPTRREVGCVKRILHIVPPQWEGDLGCHSGGLRVPLDETSRPGLTQECPHLIRDLGFLLF